MNHIDKQLENIAALCEHAARKARDGDVEATQIYVESVRYLIAWVRDQRVLDRARKSMWN